MSELYDLLLRLHHLLLFTLGKSLESYQTVFHSTLKTRAVENINISSSSL